jgi:hypothetical protein
VFFNKEEVDRIFLVLPAVALVRQYLKTFEISRPDNGPPALASTKRFEQTRQHEEQMSAAAGGR